MVQGTSLRSLWLLSWPINSLHFIELEALLLCLQEHVKDNTLTHFCFSIIFCGIWDPILSQFILIHTLFLYDPF